MTDGAPLPRSAALVVNAHSRRGQALFEEACAKLEAAGVTLTEKHALRHPKRLPETVTAAVERGAPMLIVGGGDGSISSSVDHLIGTGCVLGVLPLGTANSFARSLGLPLDLDGAVQVIASGKRRRVDLGKIGDDYYANCAAMGLSPLIGRSVPHGLKKYLGRVGYLLWAFWSLLRFRPFRLTVDDGRAARAVWATEVRIANGGYHGGVELVEQAEVDSGEIVVQAVTGRSVARLLWDWFAKYWKLPRREATTEEFHGRRLTIDTRPRLRISIDGEVAMKTPVTVEVARGAIEVAAPANL